MLHDPKKAVVVLSGGQDSTTCLYWALAQGYDVHTVTIDYHQKHRRELESAMMIAGLAGIDPYKAEVIKLGADVLQGTSPLVNKNEKLEQYQDHNSLPGGLEKTFVPMRNQLFLTIAANRAYCIGSNILVTGVCQADYGGYPDCRRSFIDALEIASSRAAFDDELPNLRILTPLMNMSKADSVRMALQLPGCYKALSYSHTAYDGIYPPVGHDHASLLRTKGFIEADVPDPLVLRAVREGLMPMPWQAPYDTPLLKKYYDMIDGVFELEP